MKKSTVARFFADVGVKLRPNPKARLKLYVPRAGERAYTACGASKAGEQFTKLFYIRIRAGTGPVFEIRADAVVLRSSTLRAFDFWKRKPVPAGTAASDENYGVDVTEVEYEDVLSLRFRWVGMTAQQVKDTFLL